MSIFGPIIHGGHIEQAALTTLQTWLPTYLAEVAENDGRTRGVLPAPRAWTVAAGIDDRFPEQALPTVAVTAPALAGEPDMRGDGSISTVWELAVGVIVAANSQAAVEDLAHLYAAAVRTCLIQKRLTDLAGFEGARWMGESYDEVTDDSRRSLASGIVSFEIAVSETANAYAGPTDSAPRPSPHVYDPALPTVQTADATARPVTTITP